MDDLTGLAICQAAEQAPDLCAKDLSVCALRQEGSTGPRWSSVAEPESRGRPLHQRSGDAVAAAIEARSFKSRRDARFGRSVSTCRFRPARSRISTLSRTIDELIATGEMFQLRGTPHRRRLHNLRPLSSARHPACQTDTFIEGPPRVPSTQP